MAFSHCIFAYYYSCSPPSHIPFRDSKLTRILQPSLSGQAKVVVICTISPTANSLEESNNTLKFAARVKRIVVKAKNDEVGQNLGQAWDNSSASWMLCRCPMTRRYFRNTVARSWSCAPSSTQPTMSSSRKKSIRSPCFQLKDSR